MDIVVSAAAALLGTVGAFAFITFCADHALAHRTVAFTHKYSVAREMVGESNASATNLPPSCTAIHGQS